MQFNQNLQDAAELLPPVVLEMVNQVGFADTEKIVQIFGVSFCFTDGAVYFPKLAALIGRESAVKLRRYFQSEVLYIPRCQAALRMLRNQQFQADFYYLTEEMHKSARLAMLELCPKYNISDRYGWKIITSHSSSPSFGVQACLF